MTMELPVRLPPVYEPLLLVAADDAFTEARRRALEGAPEGTLVWLAHAEQPTGQSGSPWRTAAGGLHAALILRPDFPLARAGELGPLACVALGAAVAELSEPMTVLGYRWPNDLWLGSGKLAGFRLEAGQAQGQDPWLVLGLNANVAATPEAESASSLAEQGHSPAGPGELLESFCRHFLDWINHWAEQGFAPVHRAFTRRLQGLGEPVRLALPGGPLEGTPETVTEDGTLVMATAEGRRPVALGEFFGLPQTLP